MAVIFSIAIGFLGISAAVFGSWIERNGPRKAMFIAACCFGGGLVVAHLGVHLHALWLIYLGYGVLGGIGMGLGYLAPVAPLIRWFPDRPGLATGLAIMGFGGGAMIGSPLATGLIAHFKTANNPGVEQALFVMGVLYFCFMMFGVFTIRIPAPDWKPAGWEAGHGKMKTVTNVDIPAKAAMRTVQFYLLWLALCLNTTAGIGIIEQAAPMVQEFFKGRVSPAAAGGFVGLISLGNMGGRFFWSSLSDYIGRKFTFMCFFVIGLLLFTAVTFTGINHLNSIALFVLLCVVIISMYGGGFATMPAYVKDLFGNKSVGVVYGRVLTAWSAAGIIGPLLVNGVREHQLHHGVAAVDAYSTVLYIMSGLLTLGLLCNALIRPVEGRGAMSLPADAPTPGGSH